MAKSRSWNKIRFWKAGEMVNGFSQILVIWPKLVVDQKKKCNTDQD